MRGHRFSRRSALSVNTSNMKYGLTEQLGLSHTVSWQEIATKAREKFEAGELLETECDRILECVREGSSM